MGYIRVRDSRGQTVNLHSSYPPTRVEEHPAKPQCIAYFADGVRLELAVSWSELAARYDQGGYGPATEYGRGDTVPAGILGTADEREAQIARSFEESQHRQDLAASAMAEMASERESLKTEKAELARGKTAHQEKEQALAAWEANLGRRKDELDARESSVNVRESALAKAQAALAGPLSGPTDPAATRHG